MSEAILEFENKNPLLFMLFEIFSPMEQYRIYSIASIVTYFPNVIFYLL